MLHQRAARAEGERGDGRHALMAGQWPFTGRCLPDINAAIGARTSPPSQGEQRARAQRDPRRHGPIMAPCDGRAREHEHGRHSSSIGRPLGLRRGGDAVVRRAGWGRTHPLTAPRSATRVATHGDGGSATAVPATRASARARSDYPNALSTTSLQAVDRPLAVPPMWLHSKK